MGTTRSLLIRYQEAAGTPTFLSQFFRTNPNLLTAEKFDVHVRRSGRKIAVPVTAVEANGRENVFSSFSESSYTPAIYKENITIKAADLWNQEFGKTVTEQDKYRMVQQRAVEIALEEVQGTIRRGVELQAAQALASATLALTDETGSTRLSLSFSPKASHFTTAATTWASSTAKLADLNGLQEQIRVVGKRTVKNLVFGRRAWSDFISDSTIRGILDTRRDNRGSIERPSVRSEDASWHGYFPLDHNEVSLWTYAASYDNPQTGADTKYINDDHILALPEGPEFDLVFGAIPRIEGEVPGGVGGYRTSAVLPQSGIGFDSIQWMAADRSAITVQIGVRALVIPTAIDTYGRLQTR
jgi:hypothetical protein